MDMKKIVIGILIMVLGILILMRNLGIFYLPFFSVLVSWQMLLVAIGVVLVFDKNSNTRIGGAILIALGVVFLIPKVFSISLSHVFIPFLLILGGIYFIVRAVRRQNKTEKKEHYATMEETPYEESCIDDQEYLKREYVFSGSKERWSYGKIKSIEIDALFSGVEIDMLDVKLSPDVDQVHIKVTSLFSGVTLYIPEEWNVVIQKTGVFGGFTDKRVSHTLPLEGKLVILELEAVFGGGEIKYL